MLIAYSRPAVLSARGRCQIIVASLVAGVIAWSGWASAAPPTGAFGGSAYGVDANPKAGPTTTNLSRVANISCPCDGTGGETKRRESDSLSAGPGGTVLKAASTRTSTFTDTTSTRAMVKNTSRTDGLNLLDGLITAGAARAVATTVADDTGVRSNDNGTEFKSLVVNGTAIAPNVDPNTQIPLPGIGYVVLREETTADGKDRGHINVNMIHLVVEKANPFLPVGAEIIVAHAASSFGSTPTEPAPIGGVAWAAAANGAIGDVLKDEIGKTALVSVGCVGTGGDTDTNGVAEISVKPIIITAAGDTTAFGNPDATAADAKTTATVKAVKLIGLISAGSVSAAAEETFDGSVRTRSTAGSGLSNVKVLGVPVTVHANTDIALPGFGHVILDEQVIPPDSSNKPTVVNGIHVFITTGSNPLGLPVGTEIIVAHAQAHAGNI